LKKILVLGGTRFFGRNLVERLLEQGHHVTILTRGQSGNPFKGKAEHLTADRKNPDELAQAVKGRTFDLVYDNICYTPNDAYDICKIFKGNIGKLVFTSSLAVYHADGKVKREEDFDPYVYSIQAGDRDEFTYAEGKRQAEAVFFQHAEFPVSAVRFPIVLGIHDYTHRLHFHIEHILKEHPIGLDNLQAKISFIDEKEAAVFLDWAGQQNLSGPYNAEANGQITLGDFISLIEQATGKPADIVPSDGLPADSISPYNFSSSFYMSTSKASSNGFSFSTLQNWLEPLIRNLVNSIH